MSAETIAWLCGLALAAIFLALLYVSVVVWVEALPLSPEEIEARIGPILDGTR